MGRVSGRGCAVPVDKHLPVDDAGATAERRCTVCDMTRSFAAAAADLLLEHGPLALTELHALAAAQGITKAKNPSALKNHLPGEQCVLRPDGRYDAAARLLRGQIFTTRARPGPDGVLWTYRDLDGLAALPRLPLSTGGELRRGQGPVESWVGLGTTPSAPLLGLRWDGRQVLVEPVADVAPFDAEPVRSAREVLARHARAQHRYGWSSVPRTSLTTTVLSALVEHPSLFATPLPPLRELLPLPEDLRPSDTVADRRSDLRAVIVEVPLQLRVHSELARRADLIGELLPDYLALLLGAAADRVQLAPPTYDGYEPYDQPNRRVGADVVDLSSWGR